MKAVLLATAVALCSTLAGAQTCNAPIQLSTATSILKVMQDLSNKLKALDGKQQVLTAAAKVSNTQVGQLAGNVGMLKSQFTADLQVRSLYTVLHTVTDACAFIYIVWHRYVLCLTHTWRLALSSCSTSVDLFKRWERLGC